MPNLMYLSGLTRFGAKHGGSEVCDGSALGFCCRNSDSCRCSYWCIVVVQEIGALPNVPFGLTLFEGKHGGSEVCDGSALGFCCRNSDSCRCSYWCIVVVQENSA